MNTQAPTSGEFRLFPKLPLELRRMIWLKALPDPVPHVDIFDSRSPGERPELLIASVNQESRSVFKSIYAKLLSLDPIVCRYHNYTLYAQLSHEAIYLDWSQIQYSGKSLWDHFEFSLEAMEKAKHVICDTSPVDRWSWRGWKPECEQIVQHAKVFINLETLHLLRRDYATEMDKQYELVMVEEMKERPEVKIVFEKITDYDDDICNFNKVNFGSGDRNGDAVF